MGAGLFFSHRYGQQFAVFKLLTEKKATMQENTSIWLIHTPIELWCVLDLSRGGGQCGVIGFLMSMKIIN